MKIDGNNLSEIACNIVDDFTPFKLNKGK